jgi:hypothetical protein
VRYPRSSSVDLSGRESKTQKENEMSDKKSVRNPKENLKAEKKAGDCTSAQLAEEELECVVGGYIGETEKNRK